MIASIETQALDLRVQLAVRLARESGQLLLEHFSRRDELVVDLKGVNDFVSDADRESEALLVAGIQSEFPQDSIVGEESGSSGARRGEIWWAIDPLDGTSNFLRGNPNWCVSIGIFSNNGPAAGVLYDPVRDEMFEGVVGFGARLNGKSVQVSEASELNLSHIGIGHNPRIDVNEFIEDTRALLETGIGFIQVGAGALMLAHVAVGRVDAYYESHMWPWDAVAGLALIKAAGGSIRPYCAHSPLAEGDIVLASSPGLYAKLEVQLQLHEARD